MEGNDVKRSKDAIISRVLDICLNGASKTKIVYQANLNFRTVIPYIELLTKNELLESSRNSVILYKTTPKGVRLLEEFKCIQNLLPEIYEQDEGAED
jgi:predicted transcriptional regulator